MTFSKILSVGLLSFLSVLNLHAQWETTGNTLASPEESRFGSRNEMPVYFISNNATKMTLRPTTTPMFGIGTTLPNFNLHIHGTGAMKIDDKGNEYPTSSSTESCIQLTNATSGTSPSDGLRIGVLDDLVYFASQDHLRMSIINDNAQMSLVGAGRFDFFGASTSNSSRFNLFAGPDNGMIIDKDQGAGTFGLRIKTGLAQINAFEVFQSNTHKFVIRQNGQVGIGTGSPDAQYMLDVAGKIRGCEVRVNNPGWCDYVFAPDYQLMPISQLADYIRQNYHLPEMPSEAQVNAEGGFDLAQMNTALLKRAEENTLYIIQLEERIARLEALLLSSKN
ncbi:MAG: hypothetical protein RLZZ262_1493 [Bacteroidota bacterium]|jgi:hypothetical protein